MATSAFGDVILKVVAAWVLRRGFGGSRWEKQHVYSSIVGHVVPLASTRMAVCVCDIGPDISLPHFGESDDALHRTVVII